MQNNLIIVIFVLEILRGIKGDCGVNETWTDTDNNDCQKTCFNPSTPLDCIGDIIPGCVCIDGHFRDSFGNCVLLSDCDGCGGDVRKEFKSCGNVCPITCVNKDTIFPCPAICLPGECGCKPEYVQDVNGNCIYPRECPDCGPNAHYACGSACDTECATLGQDCPIKNIKCVERCYCDDGYARNVEGDCIPIDQCPVSLDVHGQATTIGQTANQPNSQSSDVAINCTQPNTVFTECVPCDNTCEIYQTSGICNFLVCNPGCTCAPGFYYDSNGNCVEPSKCDFCGYDGTKVWSPCGNLCPVTCENYGKIRRCPRIRCLQGGCRCRSDLVEDIHGNCIDPSECPECGPNENYACGSACDTECATLGQPCPLDREKCVDRCYCNKGFARNQEGVCVPIDQCPKEVKCPVNAVYNPCPIICPPQKTCDNYLLGLVGCIYTERCYPRCECKEGYINKEVNGTCILPSKCCDDRNAEMVVCPNPCPGGTCEQPDFEECDIPDSCYYKQGCQCKKGFVKNKQGKCVRLSKC